MGGPGKSRPGGGGPAGTGRLGRERGATRLAALDVGSNSIRCIVVEARPGGHWRVLDDEKATVRLGEGLGRTGRISRPAWERALAALRRMRRIVDGLGASHVEAVATSAVRGAANRVRFLDAVARETGFRVRAVGGEEEAELAAASALHHFGGRGVRLAVADIGGGSFEVATATGHLLQEVFSLDLGAVALTERFVRHDPVRPGEFARLGRRVRRALARALGQLAPVPLVVGSGGTMGVIAQIVMAQRGERYDGVHGYEVLRSEVVHVLAMLRRTSARERRRLPGLAPERADIILAGVAAVDGLMEHLEANRLVVNDKGIREGLILRALRRLGLLGARGRWRAWRPAVARLARACGVDEGHARHVTALALGILDQLPGDAVPGPRPRDLLEAAGMLHDVGYFVSYPGHHKHSYHLIRHAELPGFTPREREVVAGVARYHRRALPRRRHDGYAALSAEDRRLVRRLGGILRLADGLDRTRGAHVRSVRLRLGPGHATLLLEGEGDLAVEAGGAREKGDLFERAFGRRLVVRRAPRPRR